MGTDDLHHRRKAKAASDLGRRRAKRAPYEKVLIVCEGEKTEPNYFQNLKDHHGLNSANIEICGNCGSDPLSIVRFAKQRFQQEKDAGDPFDKVFCVFDKDSHANYEQALAALSKATPKGVYKAITSVPCFEYWLLLHFIPTNKPYAPLPGRSAADQVISELQSYMPDYAKGQSGIFTQLLGQLGRAKAYAIASLKAASKDGTDNPSTHIHELVEYLEHIKDDKK